MRSRRCNAEQTSKTSLGNWEGEVSDEAKPEELPDLAPVLILRATGGRVTVFLRFSVLTMGKFFYCQFIFVNCTGSRDDSVHD